MEEDMIREILSKLRQNMSRTVRALAISRQARRMVINE
jgi:hypothetical protein